MIFQDSPTVPEMSPERGRRALDLNRLRTNNQMHQNAFGEFCTCSVSFVVAAAKLEHQNIVAAHDADEANGIHFLVMQYVDGSDLSALVKKNGPMPVAQAVDGIGHYPAEVKNHSLHRDELGGGGVGHLTEF